MEAQLTGIEVLHAIESDAQVFEPELEGFALWPVVRLLAWQKVSGIALGSLDRRLWKRLLRQPVVLTMPIYAAYAAWQRHRLRKCRPAFLFHSSEGYRSVKRNDGWWNVYLDDLANHPSLRDEVVRSEMRVFALSPWRTSAPRHLFTDAQSIDMALGALAVPDRDAVACADAVVDTLVARSAVLDRPLGAEQVTTLRVLIRQSAKRFRRSLHWYRRLLADLAPRVLVLTNAYSDHGLVGAAIERSIRVVEFQHGLIHADHPGYIWTSSVRPQRSRMPIPELIATYGQYWSDVLTRGGFWRHEETPPTGSIRMDWLRSQRTVRIRPSDPLRLVFTSQFATRHLTVPILREFLGLADASNLRYELTVKVHRREHAHLSDYRLLARRSNAVRVMSAYQGDTLALIADADAHLSGWSTCHFESVGLGTPTIVLHAEGPDRVGDLQGMSSVLYARNAGELLAAVKQVAGRGVHDAPARARESDTLFRENALEHGVDLLRGLLENG